MKSKICSNPDCVYNGQPQPITNFYPRYNKCKKCLSLQRKQYRDSHKEKIKKQKHESYLRNKDHIEKRNKEYYNAHHKKMLEYKKQFASQLARYDLFYNKLKPYYDENYLRKDPKNSKLIQVRCKKCNKWFNPTNKECYNRIFCINNLTHGESNFYCSDECKNNCEIFNKTTDILKNNQSYCSYKEILQNELRDMVLQLDNYTCQICGKSLKDYPNLHLHCHHIISKKLEPILSSDINNCITLCDECHKKIHLKNKCTAADIHYQILEKLKNKK